MRAIWVDAGDRDEYYLDFGAVAFHRALEAAGVPGERVHFELFEAGARGHRVPLSARPRLALPPPHVARGVPGQLAPRACPGH
ncbi:hypothetical protein GCM10020220_093350 [Nonomuraea rubra]